MQTEHRSMEPWVPLRSYDGFRRWPGPRRQLHRRQREQPDSTAQHPPPITPDISKSRGATIAAPLAARRHERLVSYASDVRGRRGFLPRTSTAATHTPLSIWVISGQTAPRLKSNFVRCCPITDKLLRCRECPL